MSKDIKFFYCYSKRVNEFLSNKNVPYITIAIEPITGRKFTMYLQDKCLSSALKEYKELYNK